MLIFIEENPSMIYSVGHILRVTVIIIVTGFGLKAQSFNSSYNFKHLNVQNGLTQNIVYHFLQDSRGYMWIGTHNGLSLYDGIKTTNFLHNDEDSTSIARNFISNILEDSSQQVWVSNENGIERYNRNDNTFTHFGIDRPDGTKEYSYCQLLGFVSANELWFLDTKTRSVRVLDIKTKRTSFIADLDATNALLYIGSKQAVHIWSSYDKGTIHQVYRDKKLIEQQIYFSGKGGSLNNPELEIIHVFQQNDSTAWLSTNEGVVKLNPLLNTYSIYNEWQKQKVKEVRYTTLSPNGQLWVATGEEGLYTFDINTNQFVYNFRNNKLNPFSICSDNIVALYFDKMGNVWCGSYGNGCSYANTENVLFTNYLSKDETRAWNSDNNILWLSSDAKENLWLALTDAGGFWILDKEYKIKAHKIPLQEDGTEFTGYLIKSLFDRNGNILMATNKGLYKYTASTNTLHPVKYELISEEVQGSIWIKDMIQLHDGSIIFSTYSGLYQLTNEQGKFVVKPISFLPPGAYTAFGSLFQDQKDFIYIKSQNDSLYILKPTGTGRNFELFKSMHLMPDVNYFFNEKNDSVIYIATNYGLYYISNDNFHLEKENCDDKLPFIDIRSVFKKDNKLWIFGEKGLYLFDKKSKQGRTYTVEDGLPSNEFSFSSLVFDSGQRCIAGTANGLVSFFPDRLQGLIYPPGSQLTGIYINDKLVASPPNSNEINKINLSFKENTFSFDYSSIAFHHVSECSFEYMLEGYDENWIKGGNAHYTRYSKIPPGNYVFKLRVSDATGSISPNIKSLEIQIAKAFWQTYPFKIAVLACILLMGWLSVKWYFNNKIRKQKREFERQQLVEKERTRIATDMHDDLGAGLSRIKFLSEIIGMKKQQQQPVEEDISKIREYSHEMIDKMGEIVWALNEKNDSLSDLLAYTRVYAMEYLSQNGIKCIVDAPEHFPSNFVSGEFRRNVYLTVKEALHNVVKHAQASSVLIKMQTNGKLEICIHDNGIGFDINKIRLFSNGLTNMKNRINELNGVIDIKNKNGTLIKITVPLPV